MAINNWHAGIYLALHPTACQLDTACVQYNARGDWRESKRAAREENLVEALGRDEEAAAVGITFHMR